MGAVLNFDASKYPRYKDFEEYLDPIPPDEISKTPWPPGALGKLASYIHHTCYASVREVSICAAIACATGVIARGFRTPTTKPLALYIMLLARSGVGKDGIHEGIPRALRATGIEESRYFCNIVDAVSGPALHNFALKKPGSLILFGEFGQRLVQMLRDDKMGPMVTFKDKLTKMFAKDYLEGVEYADAAKCLDGVPFPSMSFLGESTLGTYLQAVSTEAIEDGTLPRFLTINYEGGKNPPNSDRVYHMEAGFNSYWTGLVAHCAKYQKVGDVDGLDDNEPTVVSYATPEAEKLLCDFEVRSRLTYNKSSDIEGNPWNRSHYKALVLSCVAAVTDNFMSPAITVEHVQWALSVVELDIAIYQRRVESGEIAGNDDSGREKKVLGYVHRYFEHPLPHTFEWAQPLKKHGLIPHAYLSSNLIKATGFKDHKLGGSVALKLALAEMEKCGKIKILNAGEIAIATPGKAAQLYKALGE